MNGNRKPVLEWFAASIGLVLTVALLGFIGLNAIQQQGKHARELRAIRKRRATR